MNKCHQKIDTQWSLEQTEDYKKETDNINFKNFENSHLLSIIPHPNLSQKIFITPPYKKRVSVQNSAELNQLPTITLKRYESEHNKDLFTSKKLLQNKLTRPNNRWLQSSQPINLLDVPINLNFQKSLTKSKQKLKLIRKSNEKQCNYFATTPRKLAFLKETTSTVSTDNNKCPAFVRIRSQKCNRQKNQNIFSENNFVKLKEIGRGKFGKVWIVRQKKTNFCLALKILDKSYIKKNNSLEQFIRELKIQMILDHPSIIKPYGFFQDEQNFYIMLQLACDGELYKLIQKGVRFSEQSISFIIKNILYGIDYMHNMKILHRDVKPENIVVTHGTVKLCDFGCAVKMNQNELRSTFCGTPLYFSPQLLKDKKYDQKVDLWAIGILAYELFYNHSPFQIRAQCELQKIMTDEINFGERPISEDFKKFLLQILQKNPEKRLNSKELIQTQFIQAYKQLETCQQLCR